jgi:hypothetical protein
MKVVRILKVVLDVFFDFGFQVFLSFYGMFFVLRERDKWHDHGEKKQEKWGCFDLHFYFVYTFLKSAQK